MKLLVIVICLLSERFLMHSMSYQRFSWFADYAKRILQLDEKSTYLKSPWLKLATIVLPIVITSAIIYCALYSIIFGFAGLILSIIIFFYCLGPQNAFYPVTEKEVKQPQIGHYFALVNSQLFAVIFWYILAGPIAIIAYRLISLSQTIPAVHTEARQATNILEWLPARLTAILYLLVGNFQQGFVSLRQYLLASPEKNDTLLSECGLQAVRTNPDEEIPMPVAETLVEQATIVLLVMIALFTLAAWM
ncbi:MAG: hypothetical protein EPN84_01965 [Legionella sp.]|nr:MAG: hypothetical protein EPN84_01965 [Legionella sp.]